MTEWNQYQQNKNKDNNIAKKGLVEITMNCSMTEWNQYQQNKNEESNIAPYASTALAPGGLGAVVFEHVVPHSKAH